MSLYRHYTCDVCGAFREQGQQWFLVTENRWGDTVDILAWDPVLAGGSGVRHVCSTGHVHSMLAQWMRTGELERCHNPESLAKSEFAVPYWSDESRKRAAQIGELTVDQATLNSQTASREALMSVLDAIEAVLQDHACDEEYATEAGEEQEPAALVFDA